MRNSKQIHREYDRARCYATRNNPKARAANKAIERTRERDSVLGTGYGAGSPTNYPYGTDPRSIVCTITAVHPIDSHRWFDLDEIRGIDDALAQAGKWRRDSRLAHWTIEIYEGLRSAGLAMRRIGSLQETA